MKREEEEEGALPRGRGGQEGETRVGDQKIIFHL